MFNINTYSEVISIKLFPLFIFPMRFICNNAFSKYPFESINLAESFNRRLLKEMK